MEISFTLEKMEELYNETLDYYNIYQNSLNEINQIIQELSLHWKSDETKTYQEFYQKYQEKLPKLLEIKDLMKQFCNQIEIKKNEFLEATDNTINSFEQGKNMMEAKNIINPIEIQKIINELKELTERVEKNFINMNSLIESTVNQNIGVWDGESAHQFKAKWDILANDFPNSVEVLQKQVKNMEIITKKMQETDTEN